MSALTNRSSASTVSGTSSADSITNAGSFSTIDAGKGNDTIINTSVEGMNVGDDEGLINYEGVTLQGAYSSLVGGDGNDLIIDLVGRSTINAGKGNDAVTLGAYSTFEYSDGDGNDTIVGYSSDNTIHLLSGSLKSTVNSGKNVVLTVGSGKLTLKNAKGIELNIVDADSEVPTVPVDSYDRRIVGTAEDDTLYTQNPNVTVRGAEGNDLIINSSNIGNNSMLVGGDGDDTIVSNSRGVLADGGDGNDLIELAGLEQTVRYRGGDGNDTVLGYTSTDTIHIVDGSSYSTAKSGNDLLIKIGKETLTLKDAAAQTLNIDDTLLDSEIVEPDWLIAEPGASYLEYHKKKGIITVAKSFYGEVDAANFDYSGITKIDASSVQSKVLLKAGKASAALIAGKGEATLIGGKGNDKLYGSPSSDTFVYTVGDGQDVIGNTKDSKTLYQAEDQIVIVGADIYNLSDVSIKDTKTAAIITFNGDKRSKLTVNKASVDTPLTILFGPSSDTALEMGGYLYGDLPDGVHYASKGNYTRLNVDDTLDGLSLDTAQINSQIVTVDASNAVGAVDIYGNSNNNVIKASKGGSYIAGGAGNDQLYGSSDESNVFEFQMQNTTKKDVIYNYKDSDRIIIDASLLESGTPTFDEELGLITYDGAKANFNGFNDSKDDVVITLNKKNTLTLKNAAGKAINLYDENNNLLGVFGHFLPDGLSYDQKKTNISVSDTELAGTNEFIDINLSNEDGYENKYYSTAVNVDLSGAAVDAMLVGSSRNNILKASDLHSELNGGAGNDKLYGSTAEDASADFFYSSGKDTIYNYDPETDYIYIDRDSEIDFDLLQSISAKNFTEKGNDVILNIGTKHSLTIKDGVGKVIEIFDENGALDDGAGYIRYDFSLPEGLAYDGAKRTSIEITDSDTLIELGAINLDMSNETNEDFIFATTVKKIDLSSIVDENFYAELIGNSQSNTLSAPNGGSLLYGGHQIFDNPKKIKPSADVLIGGEGEDVFVYAPFDGKDQIIDYGADDLIKLDDTYDDIDSIMISDRKNVVSVTLNGDRNSVFTITKTDINTPITFQAFVNDINGMEYWDNALEDGFVYGPDEHMSLSADGSKLLVIGEPDENVYVYATEVNSQIKTIDARQASQMYVEMVGNANSNVIYAGDGGSYLDGGYDALRSKATHDTLIGGSGEDEFAYNFELGLGGKDSISGFDVDKDYIVLDTAPKSVTTNGRELVLNFDEKIDGKRYTGSLTIRGTAAITSDTAVNIVIDGEFESYRFADKLRNAAWGSDGITIDSGSADDDTLGGNTADAWTKLSDTSYAYDYGGVQFTISGSAVKDQTPGNYFAPNSLTVIEADGIPDGILVDASNKQIILSDRLDTSNVEFTFADGDDADNYEWVTFSVLVSGGELPVIDIDPWFDRIRPLAGDGDLESIIVKESALVLPDDQLLSSALKSSSNELTFAAQRQSKK